MTRIFLVSCTQAKAHHPLPARFLYDSPWFTLARRIVEATGSPWFILSAKHGLLPPDRIIEPYDAPLKQRRIWAKNVIAQMENILPPADGVVIFAGIPYREFIIEYLTGRYGDLSIPLKGLGYQQQVNWLEHEAQKPFVPRKASRTTP